MKFNWIMMLLGALAIAVITISCINIAQQVMMMPGPVLYVRTVCS